jgi:general secretion pathway protein I
VVVALAVVAVSLTAIGSVIATTVRGVHSIDRHFALMESARAIMTGLPDRDSLVPGNLTGDYAGHRWRIDVSPDPSIVIDSQRPPPWLPQNVVVRVQSPAGPILQINTIRLRRNVIQGKQ